MHSYGTIAPNFELTFVATIVGHKIGPRDIFALWYLFWMYCLQFCSAESKRVPQILSIPVTSSWWKMPFATNVNDVENENNTKIWRRYDTRYDHAFSRIWYKSKHFVNSTTQCVCFSGCWQCCCNCVLVGSFSFENRPIKKETSVVYMTISVCNHVK